MNPLLALDLGSREIIGLLNGDLIHVDRGSFAPTAGLASSWAVSDQGRKFTLHLRHGLRFSDGAPFDADDVLFTFQVHLDEQVHSPQREMLMAGGKPVSVRKLDAYTVMFDLAEPHSSGVRIFDGIAILPKHLLGNAYASRHLGDAWGLATRTAEIAGLGPFRLKEYEPGQQIVLERNPYYWKTDARANRLPYLDRIVFVFAGSEDGQVLRFQSGETQMITGLSADNFAALQREQSSRAIRLLDAGPGLEYSLLLFNQNVPASPSQELSIRQNWFRDVRFRQAISSTIDRDAMVRLIYRGLADPMRGPVSEGNRNWVDLALPRPKRDPSHARELLRQAGFSWDPEGRLRDSSQHQVKFTILTSAGNSQRSQIAAILQKDVEDLGIQALTVTLEFRSMLDRVFQTFDYDAAVMTLASGDTDPNAETNVLVSHGNTHLWNLHGAAAAGWEVEIDQLMRLQMRTLEPTKRREIYDGVQERMASNVPMIYLVSPHLLAGASGNLCNFQPSILPSYGLWNADQLYFQSKVSPARPQ